MGSLLKDQSRVGVEGAVQLPNVDRKHVGRDRDLQISRRLDWRFLLPQPDLDCVAYLGPEDGALPFALRHFSGSLKVISSPAEENVQLLGSWSFPVVVLRSWRPSDLETANSLLSPGGSLYWEIDRKAWSLSGQKALRRFCQLYWRDPVASLKRLGFASVETYWHYPNFEACRQIIPLNDRSALAFVFSRDHASAGCRLLLKGARALARTWALRHLVPCLSVVARKNEGTEEPR
jgi:hypothetical protein